MKPKLRKEWSIGEAKKKLRRIFLKKRSALSEEERESKSVLILRKVCALQAYKKAKTVMFFVTHGSEVRTEKMIEQAWNDNKTVLVPKIGARGCKLSACTINSLKEDLSIGKYGIREPKNRAKGVSPEKIDLVFVPGVVFDKYGHRIGYGKGYYDTWLKHISIKKRIGLAYSIQIADKLPVSEKDLPVFKVVTEKKIKKGE